MFWHCSVMRAGVLLCVALSILVGTGAAQAQERLQLNLRDRANSAAHQGTERAAAMLRALADGRIELSVTSSSDLGDFAAPLRRLSAGEIDLTLFPAGALGSWVSQAALLETPLLVRDYPHMQAILDSPWGEALRRELRDQHGWRVLDSWYLDTRHTTASRPLATPADFQGLRLRVPNAELVRTFARALEATPHTVTLTALAEALADGTVDGQESTLATIDALKLDAVQDHLALTGHLVQTQLVLVSEHTWQRLSAADRRLLRIAVLAGGIANNEAAFAREAALIETLTARGMTVTRPDRSALRAAMQQRYRALDAEFGAGVIAELITLR